MSAAPILDRDLSLDARAALNVAHAMSRANDSERRFGAAWQRALRGLTRPLWDAPDDDPAHLAWRLFAADGAQIDEFLQMRWRDSRSWVRKFSPGRKASGPVAPPRDHALIVALRERAAANDRALMQFAVYGSAADHAEAVRDTHRAVHRALADDNTSWCEWCAEVERC